jgi:hypothetical protein
MSSSTPPYRTTGRRRSLTRRVLLPATLALPLVGGSALAASTLQAAPAGAASSYTFTTVNSNHDLTFNQLLGINDQQVIVGYFGSGATGHPNQGYSIVPPYAQGNFTYQNFPGSTQTQITGVNDEANISGFWANAQGANFGFVSHNGALVSVTDPNTTSTPKVNQLLGRNNNATAVGFYNDSKGHSHAYEYNVNTKVFTAVTPPKAVSAMATGINDEGDVVGTVTLKGNVSEGFLLKGGTYTEFKINGSSGTMALGINDTDQIVGSYTDASGNSHGFVDSTRFGTVTTVDDPSAGAIDTVVNGINNGGSLVGFYTDSDNNNVVDGFTAVTTPTPDA